MRRALELADGSDSHKNSTNHLAEKSFEYIITIQFSNDEPSHKYFQGFKSKYLLINNRCVCVCVCSPNGMIKSSSIVLAAGKTKSN